MNVGKNGTSQHGTNRKIVKKMAHVILIQIITIIITLVKIIAIMPFYE